VHYIQIDDGRELLVFQIVPNVRLESAGAVAPDLARPRAPDAPVPVPVPVLHTREPFRLPPLDAGAFSEREPSPAQAFDPALMEGEGFALPLTEELQPFHLFPLYDRTQNCWCFHAC
jgi:hypothetical protein